MYSNTRDRNQNVLFVCMRCFHSSREFVSLMCLSETIAGDSLLLVISKKKTMGDAFYHML